MFTERSEMECYFSPEECRARLREADKDWRKADTWNMGDLRAHLSEVRGRLFVTATRRIAYSGRDDFRSAWGWLELKAMGRGSHITVVFLEHWPVGLAFFVTGLAIAASAWRLHLKIETTCILLVIGILLAVAGLITPFLQGKQEREELVDLVAAALEL